MKYVTNLIVSLVFGTLIVVGYQNCGSQTPSSSLCFGSNCYGSTTTGSTGTPPPVTTMKSVQFVSSNPAKVTLVNSDCDPNGAMTTQSCVVKVSLPASTMGRVIFVSNNTDNIKYLNSCHTATASTENLTWIVLGVQYTVHVYENNTCPTFITSAAFLSSNPTPTAYLQLQRLN